MTEGLKKKWIAALRSDRFKQARGRLKAGDGYCCLGVLHKVAKVGDEGRLTRSSALFGRLENCITGDIQDELAEFNDDRDWSFKRIATWLEKRSAKYLTTGVADKATR